ncbi:MAG: hypothetical protein L0206_20065, partial [Actinobacteria bacterium]|nr:hypothetical protein [Actinomycetota bacterium]
ILGVAVAPDAVSFAVNAHQILEDGDDVLGVGFNQVVEPDIDVILDLGALGEGDDQPLRCWPMFEVGAMLVPNSTTDRLTLETGLYSWKVISTRAADGEPWPDIDAQITAFVKRSVDEPTSGTLDLTFTMVDVGFTAADAPSDTRLQASIDALETTLGQAGISIGDVSYYDVSSEDEARLAVIDSTQGVDSELGELFQLSEGRTGYAINVFLVRTISGSALGVAGGVPGPVKLHGTRHSGVAVEGEDGVLNASQLAQIIAHEVGHYLGLFHPTESDPDRVYDDDPIADTTYGDSTNLMHWAVNLGSPNTDLTAGQGYVLIRNPAVQ